MISVIIVTHNSEGQIGQCLASLKNSGAEVVVVDNASTDGTAVLVRQFSASVKLIQAPRNLGFAAASNLGVRQSSGSSLLFLNPDCVCLGQLQCLEEPLRNSEKTVAVAGRLVDTQGQTQIGFNVRRLPTPASLIFELLLLNRLFPNNPVNRKYRCLDLDPERPAKVEQPAGACLLVRRKSFESCGFFDEAFFPLWFEDVDLCKKLRQQGGEILFWPKVAFQHTGGHSVNSLTFLERQIYWNHNLLYYVRKHFPWTMALAIRATLMWGMGLRLFATLLGIAPTSQALVSTRTERFLAYFRAALLSFSRWRQGGARHHSGVAPAEHKGRESISRLGSDKTKMGIEKNTVSVTVVTHNSELFLARCLDSLLAQDWTPLEVIVVDNASQDGTASILAGYKPRLQTIFNSENRGFSAAQNQAIRKASGDWILALNPDVVLDSDFVSRLVHAGNHDPAIGTVCGKLFSVSPNFEVSPEHRLDSAGIYFTPTFRHFDRGMLLPDGEEYNDAAFVFGATAAAALYRSRMIQDIAVEGEFFDEAFFLYREDADVSWRAQLQGWQCLYLPEAVGYHVRRVFPGRRQEIPEEINRHCVKNRFLMRIKNATLPLYLRNFLPATARDIGILAYCLLAERKSLGAFSFVLRNLRRTLAKRRIIQKRRRVSNSYLQNWFRFRPVTAPVGNSLSQQLQVSEFSSSALPLPTAGAQSGQLTQL